MTAMVTEKKRKRQVFTFIYYVEDLFCVKFTASNSTLRRRFLRSSFLARINI